MKYLVGFWICAISLACQSICALASGHYTFCVTRVSEANTEWFDATLNYGDIDPTRELARYIVTQRSRRANTTSIQVTDITPQCLFMSNNHIEMEINASADNWQALAEAIQTGDPSAIATAVIVLYAGLSVSQGETVIEAGQDAVTLIQDWANQAIGGAGQVIECIFKLGQGC